LNIPKKAKYLKIKIQEIKQQTVDVFGRVFFIDSYFVIALHIELRAMESDTAFFMKRHHPNHIWVAATMWTETI